MDFKKLLINVLILGSTVFVVWSASAATICLPGYCDSSTPPAAPPITGNDPPPVVVVSNPTWLQLIPFQGQNGWNYAFFGGGIGTSSAEVPYFAGWLPSQATVPDGWTFEIVAQSSASGPTALWKNQYPLSNSSLAGASFSSSYAPTDALMKVTMNDGTFQELRLYFPLTPSAEAAGYLLATLPVPEPSGLLLGLAGLALLAFVLRKQKAIDSLLFSPLI